MAKTATINVRMEPAIKKQAEELLAMFGISLSDGFNMFAHQLVRDRRLPFVPTAEPYYAAELREALAEVERGEVTAFENTAEMFAEILAEEDDDE